MIYFIAQITPALATGSSFRVGGRCSFDTIPPRFSSRGLPCFLALQNHTSPSHIIPALVLESAISPRIMILFHWWMVFRDHNPGAGCAHCYGRGRYLLVFKKCTFQVSGFFLQLFFPCNLFFFLKNCPVISHSLDFTGYVPELLFNTFLCPIYVSCKFVVGSIGMSRFWLDFGGSCLISGRMVLPSGGA